MRPNTLQDGELLGTWQGSLALVLLLAPFFIKEALFIASETTPQWLAIDYICKSLALTIIFCVPEFRRCARSSFAPLAKPFELPTMTLVRIGSAVGFCLLLTVTIEFSVRRSLLEYLPLLQLFVYPQIESSLLYWIDMSFGLVLTAFAEELTFRGIFKCWMESWCQSRVWLVVLSSIVFGLIHWSHGVPNVVFAILFGVIAMVLYLRLGSIVPPIIVHYLVNVGYFA